MTTTRGSVSEQDANPRRTRPDGDPAGPRSTEDVAREIGASGPAAPGRPGGEDDALRDGGPLRFDKSGALAGRPKLRPVRAHRKDDDAAADTAAPVAPEEASAARPRKAVLPPRLAALRPDVPPEAAIAAAAAGEDDEVAIPAGTFLYGESRRPCELPAFQIDRTPVTNADYAHFVRATGHRPPLYWKDGTFPEALADHPVAGLDYYDALGYARWRGKDLPYEDEWERAARGTDGRIFPWGDDPELSGANTARVGVRCTVPVDLHRENVSPDGVRDLVGNVWEITHSPAPGGGVVVRGGSWYDFALYAKTYFRFASRPDARNGTIGFRCVRREHERPEAAREVSPAKADAEIAARQGEAPATDRSGWSVEKRDLLPDLQRLQSYVLETRAEALLGARVPTRTPPPRPAPRPPPEPAPRSQPAPERAPVVAPAAAAVPPVPAEVADVLADVLADELADVLAEEAPAPVVVEPAPRLHVESAGPREEASSRAAPPETTARPPMGGEQASMDIEKAAAAVASAETAARARRHTARGPGSMPITLWVLLCVGFLLFGGLLVLLMNGDDPPKPATDATLSPNDIDEPQVAAKSPLADLPETARYEDMPGAGDPPRVLDGAYASDRGRLDTGLWLLLLLDPETDEGVQSLRTAHALHRRVAPHGVNVTVVLPRKPFETAEGRLVEDDALDVALRAAGRNWLWDGIHVVLDPQGEEGRGVLAGKYSFENEPVAAMLLQDGRIEQRTAPPEGGFTEASLARLVLRALDLERGDG